MQYQIDYVSVTKFLCHFWLAAFLLISWIMSRFLSSVVNNSFKVQPWLQHILHRSVRDMTTFYLATLNYLGTVKYTKLKQSVYFLAVWSVKQCRWVQNSFMCLFHHLWSHSYGISHDWKLHNVKTSPLEYQYWYEP